MYGTLHIFRRSVVNGAPVFQVNYTFGGRSFAKVMEGEHALRDFLLVSVGLEPKIVDGVWHQMATGNATVDDVSLSDNDAIANGMVEAPSDF